MLAQALVSIYRQYKEDTNTLATWLASTACDYGYPEEDLINSTPFAARKSKPKAKAKGKGGKGKAKRRHRPPTATCSTVKDADGKHVLAIADFVPLATYIATLEEKVPFTHALRFILDRVITTRSSFLAQLIEHGANPDAASDAKHEFFVGVLRKVRTVLRKLIDTCDGTDAREEASEEDDVTNMFNLLKLYEPSDEFLNAPDAPKPAEEEEDAQPSTLYAVEPLDTIEEARLAWLMANKDIDKLRSSILWAWAEVKEGRMDISAAALATNTAIDLARNITNDIVPLLLKHRDESGFDLEEKLEGHLRVTIDCYEIIRKNRQPADPEPIRPFVLRFASSSAGILNMTRGLGYDVPIHKTPPFDAVDPTADRRAMTEDKQARDDSKLLKACLLEQVTVLRLMEEELNVQDAFLRSVHELLTDPKPSTAVDVAIAAQVFLDVFHLMSPDVRHTRNQVALRLSRFEGEVKAYNNIHQNLRIGNYSRDLHNYLIYLPIEAARLFSDRAKEVRCDHWAEKGYPHDVAEARVTNPFLSMSPVLSGTLLFYYREELRERGMSVARAWGSIIHVAHLYNALKQEGLLKQPWEDMESLLTVVSEDSLFFSKAPTERSEYFKNLSVQIGLSTTAFSNLSKRRKASQVQLSKGGPRRMRCLSPVTDMFLPRYIDDKGQIDWTPEHVDNVLSRSLARETETPKPKTPKYKKAIDGGHLPADELIKQLALALDAETDATSFPFLYMHVACWSFISHLYNTCHPTLVKMHGEYISTPQEYPTVIELILLSYSGIHTQPGEDGLLHKAADAVDAMLTRGWGSLATKDWQARLHPSPDADVNAWPKDSTWRVSSLPGAREEVSAESALGAIFGAFSGR